MYKKVFKTIFIMSLCLCLTLPSNASQVSVSDGSAFVTKSEMSYELNNLSNRMSQLENSLDSKIDTLVSSYLTRNGVWNGADQTLENYYIVDCCGNDAANFTAKTVTHGFRNFQGKTQLYTPTFKSKITAPAEMNNDNLLHKVERGEVVIVNSVSKTGLLYITLNVATLASVFDMTSDDRTFMTFIAGKRGQDQGSTARLTYVGWFFDWCANDKSFYRCKLMYQNTFDRSPIDLDNYERYLCFTTPYNTFKIYTFVNKGDKISLKDYFEFKKNTGNGHISGANHAYYAGVIGTVDDCAIY